MTQYESSLDLPDDEFLEAFERSAITARGFPHRAHVRMAWLYARRLGVAGALVAACHGVRRLAGAHGHPELYHETLTRAWVLVIAAAAAVTEADEFDAFLDRNPRLLEKGLLLEHYSPDVLWSSAARAAWIPPDRTPLPPVALATPSARRPAATERGWYPAAPASSGGTPM